jgi:putative FmdB family regulatory protein
MPLYEYQCQKCRHRFEKIQKFSDKPIKKCPECGGRVEQVINAPAVQFKGSGWYVTDYAKSGASSGDGGKDKDKDKDAKTETAKTESAGKESSTKENSAKESIKASSSKKADKHK